MSTLRNEAARLAQLLADAPNNLLDTIATVYLQPGLKWPINISAEGDEAVAHRWHLYVGGYRSGVGRGVDGEWIADVAGDNGVAVTVTEAKP
jgi:hypothetical protein